MSKKPIKIIDVKFRGIDDWHRPVFKTVDSVIHYGSTDKLFDHWTPISEINDWFREHPDQLQYFGTKFNCEPEGGMPSHYKLNIIDDDLGNN